MSILTKFEGLTQTMEFLDTIRGEVHEHELSQPLSKQPQAF